MMHITRNIQMQRNSFNRAIALTATLTYFATAASSQVFAEKFEILSDESSQFDNFGGNVVIENEIIYTSRSGNLITSTVFLYDEFDGSLIRTLNADDQLPADNFGASIAVENGIVAVSSPEHNDAKGAVYLFDSATGTQLMKLEADDASANPFFAFGFSLDIEDGIVAVGAFADSSIIPLAGSVYLFDANTGAQLHKLVPDDGVFGGAFGIEVELQNNLVAISANSDATTDRRGMVYIYDTISGDFVRKLTPADLVMGSGFGASLDADQNMLLIGAIGDSELLVGAGAAYLYDLTTGNLIRKILPTSPVMSGKFGTSVAIDQNIIAIGAPEDFRNGEELGSVYLHNTNSGEKYAELMKINPDDDDESMGLSIDISQSTIAVGSLHRLGTFGDQGSVLVYNRIDCAADLFPDANLDFLDISSFLSFINSSDPSGDFNGDGSIDFFDISAFLTTFSAGCP